MKKIQIAVMGSAADLNYSEEALNFAKELGKLIAESNNILVYGAEKEYTSLSTEAAKVASENNGITVGVAGGKSKNIYGEFNNNSNYTIKADFQKFQQILYNLLSNAIKFTGENGTIKIIQDSNDKDYLSDQQTSGRGQSYGSY